jgi:hypothetical protein
MNRRDDNQSFITLQRLGILYSVFFDNHLLRSESDSEFLVTEISLQFTILKACG